MNKEESLDEYEMWPFSSIDDILLRGDIQRSMEEVGAKKAMEVNYNIVLQDE